MSEAKKLAGLPALIDRPVAAKSPGLLLSHGAGGDKDGLGLRALAQALSVLGHVVVRFDLPYRQQGRKSPPAAEKSAPAFFEVLEAARKVLADQLWVVGGKSYGGRVASLAVAQGLEAVGLLFYGYPLHPPGKMESVRVDHWPKVPVPCLFLQGSRDPFCDLGELERHLPLLEGGHELITVEGGDHSLKVRGGRTSGHSRDEAGVIAGLASRVSGWLKGLGG